MTNTLFTQLAISSTETELLLHKIITPVKRYKGCERSEEERLEAKYRRIENIQKCYEDSYVKYVMFRNIEEGDIINVPFRCNHRTCCNCVDVMKSNYRRRLREIIKNYKECRFMTVSMRNTPILTRDYIRKCHKEFARYREYLARPMAIKNIINIIEGSDLSQKQKDKLTGYYSLFKKGAKYDYGFKKYISVMEIKENKKGEAIYGKRIGQKEYEIIGYHKLDNWNLHYHIIYEGSFIPIPIARNCLKRATKGKSFYVTIRYVSEERIKNKVRAMNYITKYITKMYFQTDNYKSMLEYYTAIKRLKFVLIYAKQAKSDKKKPEKIMVYERYIDYLTGNLNIDYYESQEIELTIQRFMLDLGLTKILLHEALIPELQPYIDIYPVILE